jgi:hypothetical protein
MLHVQLHQLLPRNPSLPPSPLPNLVLPTWEQTFNTAPRNMLPVTNKPERYPEEKSNGWRKLLGKTMRFVSGVLFARDTRHGSLESEADKGKERMGL